MPGRELTSSSAVSLPPVRLEMVPPVATSRTLGRPALDGPAGDWAAGEACVSAGVWDKAAHPANPGPQNTVRISVAPTSGARMALTIAEDADFRVPETASGSVARRLPPACCRKTASW